MHMVLEVVALSTQALPFVGVVCTQHQRAPSHHTGLTIGSHKQLFVAPLRPTVERRAVLRYR
jgi:hypothetical protein